jgi:ComF family protein
MNFLSRALSDFTWILFPELCASCSRPLFTGENCICTLCRFHLPRTFFHLQEDNPVVRHFWGKVRVRNASAYYYFSKGEKVQKLIHQLKYKGRKDVGVEIGRLMGYELRSTEYEKAEIIIPVPLHKKRLKKRGYNQSDCFAEGLAEALKIKFDPEGLLRTEETSTQTRKHRFERYRNVENVFSVRDQVALQGKTILLVDDVITTGSTLISCAETILSVKDTTVMIGAIACA